MLAVVGWMLICVGGKKKTEQAYLIDMFFFLKSKKRLAPVNRRKNNQCF